MRSQVPSPTHVSESQCGGKISIFRFQGTIKIWLIIIKVRSLSFYAKIFTGLVLRVGFGFLLNPTVNTSPEAHFQKVLPC